METPSVGLVLISLVFVRGMLLWRTTDKIEKVGKSQYQPFNECSVSLTDSTKRFDCNLFLRLCNACQTRKGNLEDFFMHENQLCPPSIYYLENISHAARLIFCSASWYFLVYWDMPSNYSILIDGAAIVNMIKPDTTRTHLAPIHLKCFYHIAKSNCNILTRVQTSSGMSTRKFHWRQTHERDMGKAREEKWNPTTQFLETGNNSSILIGTWLNLLSCWMSRLSPSRVISR